MATVKVRRHKRRWSSLFHLWLFVDCNHLDFDFGLSVKRNHLELQPRLEGTREGDAVCLVIWDKCWLQLIQKLSIAPRCIIWIWGHCKEIICDPSFVNFNRTVSSLWPSNHDETLARLDPAALEPEPIWRKEIRRHVVSWHPMYSSLHPSHQKKGDKTHGIMASHVFQYSSFWWALHP